MNIGFEKPLYLLAAFAAVPLSIAVSRFFKPLFALDLPLGPPGGIAFKSPISLKTVMRILHVLELIGVFLLFAAVSGPRLVFTELVWLNRGADILFVLDISPSMAGIDMNGRSRFDAAKTLLRDFAERRPNDAVGLITLGEDAALLVPLTTDRSALYSRLDSLAVGEMGDGTALGTGLALAALHIDKSRAPGRAVVLITDGENNAGTVHPETAAAVLRETGVSLWVIGVGSSGEIPVSYTNPFTGIRRTGTFESRFDPEKLKAIAEKAGGQWINAPRAEAFAAAFSRLDREEMVIRRSGSVRREEPLYIFFLLAAVILVYGVRFVRRVILGALI